jgi:hypothetical protein
MIERIDGGVNSFDHFFAPPRIDSISETTSNTFIVLPLPLLLAVSQFRDVIKQLGHNVEVDIEYATIIAPPPALRVQVR